MLDRADATVLDTIISDCVKLDDGICLILSKCIPCEEVIVAKVMSDVRTN